MPQQIYLNPNHFGGRLQHLFPSGKYICCTGCNAHWSSNPLVAHKIGHINEKSKKDYFKWSIIAPAVGLGINIIADPVVGFFRNKFLLGLDTDLSYIVGKLTAGVTFVNALLSCICIVILHNLLRPALSKAGLLPGAKRS